MSTGTCQMAIIGAGPYGLAATAHLRGANVETHVFGGAEFRMLHPRFAFSRCGGDVEVWSFDALYLWYGLCGELVDEEGVT